MPLNGIASTTRGLSITKINLYIIRIHTFPLSCPTRLPTSTKSLADPTQHVIQNLGRGALPRHLPLLESSPHPPLPPLFALWRLLLPLYCTLEPLRQTCFPTLIVHTTPP